MSVISQPPLGPTRADVEGDLASLLVRFGETVDEVDIDRTALARSIREIVAAQPLDTGEGWWRWALDAGRGVGLRLRVLEVPLNHAWELARAGAQMATYIPSRGGFALLGKARWRKGRTEFFDGSGEWASMTIHDWVALTGIERPDRPVCWITVEPLDSAASLPDHGSGIASHALVGHGQNSHGHGHGRATPFARLRQLLRPEWPDIFVVLVFAVCVGLLFLATPIAVESLVNTVAFGRLLQPVIVLAAALLTFLIFAAVLLALQTFVVEIIQRRLFVRVAGDLAWRLPRVRYEVHDSVYEPELVNRFFDVVTIQKAVAQLLLDGVTVILGTAIGMAVLAFYHPFLLGFDLALLLAMGFMIHVLGRGAVDTSIRESVAKYRLADWLEEISRGRTTFKAAGALDLALERLDHLALGYLENRRRHFRIVMRQVVFALVLQAVASAALLGLGGWLVIMGQLTLGQLVAAELIVAVIVGAFAKLGKHFDSFYDLMAAVDKLGVLFDLPLEREHGIVRPSSAEPAAIRLWRVNYSYPAANSLWNELTMRVEPGEWLAVWGPSSCGKSTLLDLMYGLRQPAHGHIEFDGIDLRDLRPEQLRRQAALVRDAEIFLGSIAENLHLGRAEVTSADIQEALATVGLLGSIHSLHEGVETQLGTGGTPLSSNETRRLVLARALAARPRLLLVDGLFDVLSDDVLRELFTRLDEARGRFTMVVTTGQARVGSLCDRCVSLAQGPPDDNPP